MLTCGYCSFFQDSPTRIGKDDRFCNHIQKVVYAKKGICEDGFEVHNIFWCDNTEQQIDFEVCPARQARGMQECGKCRQKQDILEIRKLMGRKAIANGTAPKPILRKKVEAVVSETHEETQEKLAEVPKKVLIKKVAVVTAEQKPKITLHKKLPEPEVKPKITLHKRIKEEPAPVRKLIKKQ